MKIHCENPDHYDRMVNLLVQYNPLFTRICLTIPSTLHDNAKEVIDYCIASALLRGDCATGCCMALRTSTGKIRLFLEPLLERS